MATKFIHKRIHDDARDAHIALATDYSPPRPSLQRRFGVFSIGALAVCVLLLGTLGRGGGLAYVGRPVVEGVASIVEKPAPVGGDDGCVLLLEIVVNGSRVRAEARLPREHWEPLRVGDRIAVRYQTGRKGAGLRLCDVGRIPIGRTP